MSTERIATLHQRIGVLTEERDALACLVTAFMMECGPRFGDAGLQLVGELCVEYGLAFTVASRIAHEAAAQDPR